MILQQLPTQIRQVAGAFEAFVVCDDPSFAAFTAMRGRGPTPVEAALDLGEQVNAESRRRIEWARWTSPVTGTAKIPVGAEDATGTTPEFAFRVSTATGTTGDAWSTFALRGPTTATATNPPQTPAKTAPESSDSEGSRDDCDGDGEKR